MPVKVPTITDLDESQKAVVRHLPYDDPMFVNGPPGSGKTHIAILRLQVLLNNGYTNVLFLLYNHSMYGFLSTIFKKMGLSTNIQIDTKDIFFYRKAIALGYPNSNDSYGNYEAEYRMKLQYLLTQNQLGRYDVIVIDECQDFSEMEMSVLRKMSNKIIAVGDLDQSVYQNSPSSFFKTLPSKYLSTIYRFGKNVARIAQPFSKSGEKLEDHVCITNDTDVFRVKANNNSDAFAKIARIIQSKQSTNMTVAILALTNPKLKELEIGLKAHGINSFYAQANKEFRNYDFDSHKPILITPFSAKGMEFEVVILYGFDETLEWGPIGIAKKELLYVSLTRTNNELYLIDQPTTHRLLKDLKGWVDIDTQRTSRQEIADF